MLVLTRKLQQQIKIGEEITVTILRVKGNTVRVGVQAPRDVRVVRGELPKNSEETATQAAAAASPCEMTIASVEIIDHTHLTADEPVKPAKAVQPLPHPAAAHLPLRRIHDRRGAGPLKQIIASCGVLAK